jgi:uncharacterized membrane protein YfcA
MITDPWFYALAVPALLIVGISKGAFGGGLGLLAVPMMAIRLPVPQVAAIMLPILCLMDLATLWNYRGRWDLRILMITLPAGVLGTVIGAVSFGILPEPWIRLLIGGIAVGFTLYRWLARPRFEPGRGLQPVKGFFWATVAGFTSFLANAGAPPIQVYLLPLGLDKAVFVGTMTVLFAVINYAKIPSFFALHLITVPNMLTALVLVPCAPIGIWLGVLINRRVNQALFYKVCYVMLFLAGSKLISDAAMALL